MFKHPARLSIIAIFFFLQSCSGPGPSGSNSSPSPTNPTDNPTEVIGLSIESLASQTEINSLSSNRISIVALNSNFQEFSSTPESVPDYEVVKRSGGGYEIQFSALYVEQINVVVKARLDGGQVLYAPLYSLANPTDSITVSAISRYVLEKLFDTIDSDASLDEHLPCDSSVPDCPNQFLAKASLLAQASATAQNYELNFPSSTSTYDDAKTVLEQNIDIKTHIEIAVAEITRDVSPIAKGTPRAFNIADGDILTRLNYNLEYNTVWFGLSLNNETPDNGEDDIVIGASSSRIVKTNELDNALPVYPFFNQKTTLLDVRRESMISDIPFTRTSLHIDEVISYTLENSDPINSWSSQLSDSFLSTEGFVLNGITLDQTIPGKATDPKDVGWQFNPMFNKMYRANEYEPDTELASNNNPPTPDFGADPTWLINANFSSGAAYQLDSGNNRGEQLEDLNLFTWEVHSQETDNTFSTSQINGKQYGVIGYTLKLNDINNIMELFAETLHWNAVNGEMLETQPSTHYRSYTLTRDQSNTATPVIETSGINFGDRNFFTDITAEATEAFPNGTSEIQGLIGLDGETNGHSTQNGKHLAFSVNYPERGRGLMVATELRSGSASPIFNGEVYQLQGNNFGISNNFNTLQNLNRSSLTISDFLPSDPITIDCHADLLINSATVDHDVVDNTLSPLVLASTTSQSSTACRLDGGEIELQFADVMGQPLTLKGFVTRQGNDSATDSTPGKLINLLWIQNDRLGLVFANLEQSLSPTFPEN